MPSNLVNLGQRLQTVQSSQPPQQRWCRSHHSTGSFSTTVVVAVADADIVVAAADADVVVDDDDSVDIDEDVAAAPCASAHTDAADVASVETQGSNSWLVLTPSQVGISLCCSSLRSKTTKKSILRNKKQCTICCYIQH